MPSRPKRWRWPRTCRSKTRTEVHRSGRSGPGAVGEQSPPRFEYPLLKRNGGWVWSAGRCEHAGGAGRPPARRSRALAGPDRRPVAGDRRGGARRGSGRDVGGPVAGHGRSRRPRGSAAVARRVVPPPRRCGPGRSDRPSPPHPRRRHPRRPAPALNAPPAPHFGSLHAPPACHVGSLPAPPVPGGASSLRAWDEGGVVAPWSGAVVGAASGQRRAWAMTPIDSAMAT